MLRLDVREDARGWFKENWQREKMVALGLPDFGPVQNNVSFNTSRGATRGIHTEPWDKFVSLATGRVFAAWVDMREGRPFGTTFTIEMDPSVAVFVPRGVGNSYQTLEDGTAYTYLVNEHWRPGVAYPALALDDPTVAIPWPIPLAEAEISEKDRAQPHAGRRRPDDAAEDPDHRRPRPARPGAAGATSPTPTSSTSSTAKAAELDVTDPRAVAAWPWHEYAVVLNAAAYTAVDAAETPEGRVLAWAANAAAPAVARPGRAPSTASRWCTTPPTTSSTAPPSVHTEDEPLSPLGVYGQTKAAGDLAVGTRAAALPAAHLVGDRRRPQLRAHHARSPRRASRRPSSTTRSAGSPSPTSCPAPPGTSSTRARRTAPTTSPTAAPPPSGPTWPRRSSGSAGATPDDVTPITTEEYVGGKEGISPRPANSALDLAKLEATGFTPADALEQLAGLLRAAVVVLEAADVVLAEVVAALDLDDHELVVVLVGDPVRHARRRRRRSHRP